MPRPADPREARADEFYRSQVYTDLNNALNADLHGTGFNTREREARRAEIRREIAEACWVFCNEGNSGRYRIGLKNNDGTIRSLDDVPTFNTPRFNTRREALDWLAMQTDAPAEKLGVLDCGSDDLARAA